MSCSHGPQPCLVQWNCEPYHVGPPKTNGSWWRILMKRGPLEKAMANHFSILASRTPGTQWKCKNDMTLEDEPPRSVSVQYAAEEEWGEKQLQDEEAEPKWKRRPVVDVCSGESKVQCCKEQCSIGTWNVTSTNQDKLDVVKWRWQGWTPTF